MKTVTLWNVPIQIAKETVKIMRKHISERVLSGADQNEVYDLMYDLNRMEEEIKMAEKKPEPTEE